MLFNKLTCHLVFAVLLVVGLAFVAIPPTAAVTPVLSVPDEVEDVTGEADTQGIQVYGIRAENVTFELTITFQEDPDAVSPVTGFDAEDIQLVAADSNDGIVPGGATVSAVRSNANDSVYTTTITTKGNVNTVIINVPSAAANTPGRWDPAVREIIGNEATAQADQLVVNIVRSAAPPLTLSPDRSIAGNAPFTVTLTSTTAITLTDADIKVVGGSVEALASNAAKRVWTVTIRPGVSITQITVEPSANGSYIFPKATFTVDTTGPVATITGTPPVGGGVFPITITFDEPLQTGATLVPNEITVIGGSITALFAIPNTNSYVATLMPNPSATSVTVQVNAGAVTDAGGVSNVATPSPALSFRVAATATPPGTTPRQGTVTISEIMFATDGISNEIQWIELSNNSKTTAVALDADSGWELIIENYNDPRAARDPLSGTINFKESGSVKTILPNQTVLIVSANGRNSDRTHFVAKRVFKVYPTLAAEFGMRTSRDPFLHPSKGFHIKLVDGRNNLVDEVGNLDGRTRTADAPAWELPIGWTEGGCPDLDHPPVSQRRSRRWHPIRRMDPRSGNLVLVLIRKEYQNLVRPQNRPGQPQCPGRASTSGPTVSIPSRSSLKLARLSSNWATESEMDNAGFNILRSQTRMGEFKVINAQLIPGAGTTAERNTYTWTDTTAKPNVVYYYQIEDVSFDGEHQTLATVRLRGLVSVKGKLTTQWGKLKKSRD